MNKLLSSVTVPFGLTKVDLGRYFFPESLLRSIEYTTLSGFDSGKHLLLASPHPGSGVSMKRLSLFMAQKCASDHYSIDYHWFVHASKLLSKRPAPRPLFRNSKPFSPSAYEPFYEEDLPEQETEEEKIPKMMLWSILPSKDGEKTIFGELKVKQKESEAESHSGTHYDTLISKDDLDTILNRLKTVIKENKSRAIISVSDVTDMIVSTPRGCGEKVILGLIDMVNDLHNEGVEALIFAHSTPSLIDSDNLSKSSTFYNDLFDGHVSVSATGEVEESLWEDGVFFNTVLDGMKPNKFTKIPLAPPTPAFASKYDSLKAEQIFEEWLKIMEEDARIGIKEMNWKNLMACLQSRQITLSGLKWDDLMLKSDKISDKLSNLLKEWESHIWSLDDLDHIASLMVGQKLSITENARKSGEILDVTVEQLECALELASDMNYSMLIPTKDVLPHSENLWGESTNIDSTTKADDSDTVHEGRPKASEASKAQEILKSAKVPLSSLNNYEKRVLSTVINPSSISAEFKDLILPSSTKLMLQTLVTLPLLRPAYFSEGILSRHSINGVLLFGPPGTGKTLLAKAIAKSCGARFMNVSLSAVFDKYVGEGEKNVKAIFTLARKISPCVIFLDEMDALFGARRNDLHSSKREIINEFMAEWDGLMSANKGIMILGATNRPFDLDDAVLRRLPRRVLIDLPTEEQRHLILQVHLKGETLDADVNLLDLAKRTTSYSGSDLKNLCVSAALGRIKEAIYKEESSETLNLEEISSKLQDLDDWNTIVVSKKSEPLSTPLSPLSMRHFENALKEVPPSLTDEMQTLIELRKWNKQFGENASLESKKQGWGF